MIVGLTGGIGSGKTTVAKLFKTFGNIAIYHADDEAKKLMVTSKTIRTKITNLFGAEAYNSEGLNRAFISNIVFQDKIKLKQLNSIVHPEVKKHFKEFVALNLNKDYVLYENAILFESKSSLHCDFIITVFVDLETRIQRTIQRDNSTKEAVIDRMKNQYLEDKKLLQSNYVIYNFNLENTKIQVNKIHNILTKKMF